MIRQSCNTADLQPFIDTIRAWPMEEGPRLVLADWLEEQGDSRAAWLRFVSNVWNSATHELPVNRTRRSLSAYHRVSTWSKAGPDVRRLWACACLRFLPMKDGKRLGELITVPQLLSAIVEAELFACAILSDVNEIGAEAFRVQWSSITNDPWALAVYRACRSCRVDSACDAVLWHASESTTRLDPSATIWERLERLGQPINRRILQLQCEAWCVSLAGAITPRGLSLPVHRH